MSAPRETAVAPARGVRDPFALLRRMASDFDREFTRWPSMAWPQFQAVAGEPVAWSPKIDVFEKEGRLIARADLPGMKKEDVAVEVSDGFLTLSGERTLETEQTRDGFFRSEREHGSFYRAIPLPDGAKFEDVKAVFADGVLEVTVPIPVKAETRVRKVPIEQPQAETVGA